MQVIPELIAKRATELEPGELAITGSAAGRYLCIKIGAADEPRPTIVMIPTFVQDPPVAACAYQLDMHDRFMCLSYGSDWVLQHEFDELSYPNNREPYGVPGVLFISSEGPVLCLETRGRYGGGDYTFVNLRTSNVVQLPEDAWPTNNWRIYGLSADQAHPKGKPLYEHVSYVRPAR